MKKIELIGASEKLDLNDVFDFAASEASGGLNFFIGTVRNQTKGKNVLYLDYEAYDAMALKELHLIAET